MPGTNKGAGVQTSRRPNDDRVQNISIDAPSKQQRGNREASQTQRQRAAQEITRLHFARASAALGNAIADYEIRCRRRQDPYPEPRPGEVLHKSLHSSTAAYPRASEAAFCLDTAPYGRSVQRSEDLYPVVSQTCD